MYKKLTRAHTDEVSLTGAKTRFCPFQLGLELERRLRRGPWAEKMAVLRGRLLRHEPLAKAWLQPLESDMHVRVQHAPGVENDLRCKVENGVRLVELCEDEPRWLA